METGRDGWMDGWMKGWMDEWIDDWEGGAQKKSKKKKETLTHLTRATDTHSFYIPEQVLTWERKQIFIFLCLIPKREIQEVVFFSSWQRQIRFKKVSPNHLLL